MGYLLTTKRPFWRYYLHEENKNRVLGMYRQTHACKRYFVTAYRLKTLNIAYQGGRAVTRIYSYVVEIYISVPSRLKQLSSRCSKNKKNDFLIRLTINTGQVMFSEEIYYYWPLIQLTKSLVKHRFICIIYCVTNAVAVVYIILKS